MKALELSSELTIAELKKLYATNTLTPLDVLHGIIKRAEQDCTFNIWITEPSLSYVMPYIEALQDKSKDLPLWGIPFAVKDNIDVAGMPTTAGCEGYTYIPTEHADVVQQLVDAGAIPVGKTNLDQFATGLVGTRSPYGACKNALDPTLISGGSSSGSAVAVARGHVSFALGTDTAGSGRVPAALNGLIGFKPSLGAWSTRGVVPACASLDSVTVFATAYDEIKLVDQIVRHYDVENSWSKDIPLQAPALPEKILLLQEDITFFGPFEQEFRESWQQAVKQVKELDIAIEYIDGSYLKEAASLLYDGPFVAERWAALSTYVESHPNTVYPVTETILRQAENPSYTATALFQAQHKIQAYKKRAHMDLQNAVLMMPTVGGTWRQTDVEANPIATNSQLGLYTNHCNILDLCAVNVPVEGEQPFGITFFAKGGADHLVHSMSTYYLEHKQPIPETSTIMIAACGLHLKGYPLEKQMLQFGSQFIETTTTAPTYQLLMLEDGLTRPGLLFSEAGGNAIEVDLWEMPANQLASFIACIKAPLALGTITLNDGREVLGFVCAANPAVYKDITKTGGWRYL